MKQNEIMEMARKATLDEMWELSPRFVARLEAFAKLVADKERDEILKMCEPPEHSHQFVHTFKKLIAARGGA